MTDKLLNCPFCGGEALKKSYDRLIQIGCESCGYTRGFCGIIQSKIDTGVPIRYEGGKISTYEWYDKDAEKKAIAAWNTRKPMDRIVEQLEELAERHPYKVVGEFDTYNMYNEAWSDCAYQAIQIVKGEQK